MGRAYQVNCSRVHDDKPGALTQTPLHLRSKDAMPVSGICSDDHNDIRLHYGVKFLRAGRGTKSRLQAVTGGRVANPRTGVYVVVAKDSAHQLLYQERFFV